MKNFNYKEDTSILEIFKKHKTGYYPVTLTAKYHFSEEEPDIIFDISDSLLLGDIIQDNE